MRAVARCQRTYCRQLDTELFDLAAAATVRKDMDVVFVCGAMCCGLLLVNKLLSH